MKLFNLFLTLTLFALSSLSYGSTFLNLVAQKNIGSSTGRYSNVDQQCILKIRNDASGYSIGMTVSGGWLNGFLVDTEHWTWNKNTIVFVEGVFNERVVKFKLSKEGKIKSYINIADNRGACLLD